MSKPTLLQRWQTLPQKQRIWAAGGGLVALLVVATLVMDSNAPKRPPVGKPVSMTNFALPGTGNNEGVVLEKLSATVKALKDDRTKEAEAELREKEALRNAPPKPEVHIPDPNMVADLQAMRAEIEELKKKGSNKPYSLDDALPEGFEPDASGAGGVNGGGTAGVPVEAIAEAPKLRIIGDARKTSEQENPQPSNKDLGAYIPGGTQFNAVLLNGMLAPTSGMAQKQPIPVVMRVKTDAILPNRFRYDVRECFVVGSGYGVLSTERVNMQTVSLSCVKADGSIIETQISGYVVGEDGRAGLRGRLISKQGQTIAKSFAAGFIGGIGQAMAPMAVPQLNTTPGSTQQFQTPNLNGVVSSGVAQGVQKSATMLSQFYLEMAREMFPVVEIDGARSVTIMLLKGVELKLIGEKS